MGACPLGCLRAAPISVQPQHAAQEVHLVVLWCVCTTAHHTAGSPPLSRPDQTAQCARHGRVVTTGPDCTVVLVTVVVPGWGGVLSEPKRPPCESQFDFIQKAIKQASKKAIKKASKKAIQKQCDKKEEAIVEIKKAAAKSKQKRAEAKSRIEQKRAEASRSKQKQAKQEGKARRKAKQKQAEAFVQSSQPSKSSNQSKDSSLPSSSSTSKDIK